MPDSTTPDLNFSPRGLYIGGNWQESIDGGTFETINPSNLEKMGDVGGHGNVSAVSVTGVEIDVVVARAAVDHLKVRSALDEIAIDIDVAWNQHVDLTDGVPHLVLGLQEDLHSLGENTVNKGGRFFLGICDD